MKELSQPIKDNPKSADAMVKPVATQKLLQSWKKMPGHRVWELDLETKLISEATSEVTATLDGGVRHKVIQRPGRLYCSALNAANADKKFMKMLLAHTILNSKL